MIYDKRAKKLKNLKEWHLKFIICAEINGAFIICEKVFRRFHIEDFYYRNGVKSRKTAEYRLSEEQELKLGRNIDK